MLIKDIEFLTEIYICRKFNSFFQSYEQFDNHLERLKKYLKRYTSKYKPKNRINDKSHPYGPHIQSNQHYMYLFVSNHLFKSKLIIDYITFDFDAVMAQMVQEFCNFSSL